MNRPWRYAHAMFASLLSLSPLGAAVTGLADDWPQWRGPQRNGVSEESRWWAQAAVKPLWHATVGLGYSGVSICAGKLYTAGYAVQEEQDIVRCLDARSGTTLWERRYLAQRWNKQHEGGTNSTFTHRPGASPPPRW